MNDEHFTILLGKYHKWLFKQMQGKPGDMQHMLRRTLNTAVAVRCMIGDIPFEILSKELFFFCNDVHAKAFTRLYEAQIELASIDEDKFIKGLHKFFNETAIRIKKENHYQEYFEFVSLITRLRSQALLDPGYTHDGQKEGIMDAYQSLLMQQLEYLRPNKFDFSVVVCGITTDNEVMTIPDTFPSFDIPGYEVEDIILHGNGKEFSREEMWQLIAHAYRRHGYRVNSFEDVEVYNQKDRIFTNHHSALCAYINEYTYDIFPDPRTPLTPKMTPLLIFHNRGIDEDGLVDKLHRRARTLPTNGVEFKLESEEMRLAPESGKRELIESVLLKELLYDDAIIML